MSDEYNVYASSTVDNEMIEHGKASKIGGSRGRKWWGWGEVLFGAEGKTRVLLNVGLLNFCVT